MLDSVSETTKRKGTADQSISLMLQQGSISDPKSHSHVTLAFVSKPFSSSEKCYLDEFL